MNINSNGLLKIILTTIDPPPHAGYFFQQISTNWKNDLKWLKFPEIRKFPEKSHACNMSALFGFKFAHLEWIRMKEAIGASRESDFDPMDL